MLKVGRVTLISLTEAVKQFGVSTETLRRAIVSKRLPAIRVGKRCYLKPQNVQRWKERHYDKLRARAVKIRWERYRKKQRKAKGKGRGQSGGDDQTAPVAQ